MRWSWAPTRSVTRVRTLHADSHADTAPARVITLVRSVSPLWDRILLPTEASLSEVSLPMPDG
ncbi:hypothetical protein BJF84_22295 [Rhodococcus sp. CUA-806]|nr:hypothetical protein BJF84_22295 [Rhodococcus sp. CUA-806]